MPLPVSPLAPEQFPKMPPLDGVTIATGSAGIKYKGRTDVCLFEFAEPVAVAGVLTRSLTASAPVEWCKANLPHGRARAFLINAGNANAFTGAAGMAAVESCAQALCRTIGCNANETFLASTGVIGEPLPAERIAAALEQLHEAQRADAWGEAAKAIMTTDTYPKGASKSVRIGDIKVTINGIAKGSGMIAPDMATMLAFVVTDAAIEAPVLQKLLEQGTRQSFNSITVDGDTSTSDTLLLAATGKAGNDPVSSSDDPRIKKFRRALNVVLQDLALQVVKDGEGAQKLVTIKVSGAASGRAARRIGLAIGNSPLVKTAIAGEDANWGRIVMAVGKAGEKADRDKLSISMGGVELARNGERVPDFDETPVAEHMKGRDILIEVDVGIGQGKATVWTCDLTHGYIDINADYRS